MDITRITDSLQDYFAREIEAPLPPRQYGCVRVLLLYWEESDNPQEYEDEACKLGEFFQSRFRFDVDYYRIPLVACQLQLRSYIDGELRQLTIHQENLGAPCLLIIHYGGHGDKDDDKHDHGERRAVWRAFREDGPRLRWYEIQQNFRDVEFDVLLLLDCCYSAQAGRGRSDHQGRVELLAAAGAREETPQPGEGSFTRVLIEQMQRLLDEKEYVKISELHSILSKRQADLWTTPFYLRLQVNSKEQSIRLEPHKELDVNTRPWKSQFRLLVRTTEHLDLPRINELASWLRSDAPAIVAGFQVEDLLERASNIDEFIHKAIPSRSLPLIDSLDKTTLEDVQDGWSAIQCLISQYTAKHKAESRLGKPSQTAEQWAKHFLERIDTESSRVLETLQQAILLSHEGASAQNLDEAIQDPSSELLHIKEQLILRRITLSSETYQSSDQTLLSEAADINTAPTTRSRLLEEYKNYGENQSKAHLTMIEERVKLLAALLRTQKPENFRCLRLRECEHQRLHYRFVYRFEIPPSFHGRERTLCELIKSQEGRPTLGERFIMAFRIASAVEHWHRVGWVHQGISGHNILLFATPNGSIQFCSPFLHGFDFSRPNAKPSLPTCVEDIGFNVYRHPNRQGPSRDGHQKIHDIYSMGVVLLEIGLWRTALDIIRDKYGKNYHKISKQEMFQTLLSAAGSRLAHYAGTEYQQAVYTCLKTDFGIVFDDRDGTKVTKALRSQVLDKLSAWKYVH